MIRYIPRSADERLLDWLRLRSAGQNSAEIARRTGCTGADVRNATTRVRAADMVESGEDCASAYGWAQ